MPAAPAAPAGGWASRALLLPGPQPPLSHFGVTLLRHVVGAGLRYALYHLGLPPPAAPPVRVVRLRLYLDAGALQRLLAPAPGGAEVAAALLDPAGVGAWSPGARRVAAAAALHALRLRLVHHPPRRPRALRERSPPLPAGDAEAAWRAFREELSALVPAVGDALLADVLAALARRRRRVRGEAVPPCVSRNAWRLLRGRPGRLDLCGPPDPLLPSWDPTPARAFACVAAAAARPLPPRDPLRGSFRETYRASLDRLLPSLRALAGAAAAGGALDEPEDLFFLPFDIAGDLASEGARAWIAAAVAANRREHQGWSRAPAPGESLASAYGDEGASGGDAMADADCAPLLPLP